MNEYLAKYPETDLSRFQTLVSKDELLHIDYTVTGLMCKVMDEKEGVAGLKRLLAYSSVDELFLKEFHLQPERWDSFLKQIFKKYDKVIVHH